MSCSDSDSSQPQASSDGSTGDDDTTQSSCGGSSGSGGGACTSPSGDPLCTGRRSCCGEFGTFCPCAKICILRPEALPLEFLLPTDIILITNVGDVPTDVVVIVGPDIPDCLVPQFERMRCYDRGFDNILTLFISDQLRLPVIYSPLVMTTEYHDVRVYHDAARKAFERVVLSKYRNPTLVMPRAAVYPNGDLISALGALQAVYVPLQVREENPNNVRLIKNLFVLVENECRGQCICREITAIEPALFTFRDVAMSDPERMTPIQIEDYIYELFKDSANVMEVVCDPDILRDDFPLFDMVNKAGFRAVKRYAGRVVFIEYVPPCYPRKTLMLVGKGAAFDTGGVNIKIDGLAGLSRDKAGAAVVIGFMQMVAVIKPVDIHVLSATALVRNNVGEHAYVPDEIVRSRGGRYVRFNNTDAEGRLIMSDPLTFMKEQVLAKHLPDPHLFTIGTMTQHARVYVGNGYPVIIDNSVARSEGHALSMQFVGQNFSEPFEISVLRFDDFDALKGKAAMEDIIQTNCCIHELVHRAHQVPMAFLMQSTGLCEHDLTSCYSIKYTHIDIQGNILNYPYIPANQPIITLGKVHLD